MAIPVLELFPFWDWCISVRVLGKGIGRGGSEGSDDPPPPFFGGGANFIHFLYKVLGKRSVQK